MRKRRHFGRVRKLPSGRWQARYPGPDDALRPAPTTFERRRDAELWLSAKEAEIARGEWLDPDAGRVPLREYAAAWIRERPGLRPKTVLGYGWLLRHHIAPHFGNLAVTEISTPRLRRWRTDLLDAGVSQVTAAKAYRLLRAVLNTAVADRIIARNPCIIPGAGVERSAERPVATLEQVYTIADNVPARYRMLVLLACFASLRWGELAALARYHVDLDAGTVFVERAVVELPDGRMMFGPPKSEAGKRAVTVPAALVPELRRHLEEFTGPGQDALIFTSPKSAALRRSNFTRHWTPALRAAGMSDLHFHDLRHTGNTWAAETGATLRELMERMGHSSSRAALIYLHTRPGRDKAIADGLSSLIERTQATEDDDDDPDNGATGSLAPAG